MTLAATPPMGWISWNALGARVSEEAVREIAEALVATGLRDLGYEYVVIDDCWSDKAGRDRNGALVPDPDRFPGGIAKLAEHVQGLGLKLGIYSDAAEQTCAGYAGSLGFEEQDAHLFASWGVDFLKYDYCGAPDDQAVARKRYGDMGRALRGSGRDILFSLCEWGGRAPHLWGPEAGGHMWRVTPDVFDSWVDVAVTDAPEPWTGAGIDTVFDLAAAVAEYGGPGRWNDLDMLVVGLAGRGQIPGTGLSFAEYRTHMSLWAMACSPLMIGCDVRQLDAAAHSLLGNREVLAVNQDPLGIPARRVRQGTCDVWRKPLSTGAVVVGLVNRGTSVSDIELRPRDVGLLDVPMCVRDLWSGERLEDLGNDQLFRVQPHETLLLSISPAG